MMPVCGCMVEGIIIGVVRGSKIIVVCCDIACVKRVCHGVAAVAKLSLVYYWSTN